MESFWRDFGEILEVFLEGSGRLEAATASLGDGRQGRKKITPRGRRIEDASGDAPPPPSFGEDPTHVVVPLRKAVEQKSGEGEDLESIWRDWGENSEGPGRLEAVMVYLGDGGWVFGICSDSAFFVTL